MSDWKPLSQAVQEYGGLLGEGTVKVSRRLADGLLASRARTAVSYRIPQGSSRSTPALPPNLPEGVQPLGTPMVTGPRPLSELERLEETDAELPSELWHLLSQLDPTHDFWRSGEIPIDLPTGERTTLYDVEVGPVHASTETEKERVPRMAAEWMRAERAAGRRGSLSAAAAKFADQYSDARTVAAGTPEQRIKRAVRERYPDLSPGTD